jgi:phosphopantothenoylcysteine synthetase/decarboxylase
MRCIVTAGPTYENLDNVRRLTNFSTGRLGVELAAHLTREGFAVTLLVGEQATWRGERLASDIQTFTTTADLLERFSNCANGNVRGVFHAAAVSDFTFGRILERTDSGDLRPLSAGKVSTRQGTLLAELVPTPKVISRLREFFPDACLTGWKFEVDGDHDSVLEKGRQQLADNQTDACVVNGRAYGDGFGLLTRDGVCRHFADRAQLFAALRGLLEGRAHTRQSKLHGS